VRQSAHYKQVAKAKPPPASTAAYPAVPCLNPLHAGRRSGATPLPKKQRRKKKYERRRKHTHTHYTNGILLGASVSDHPQNFATKEVNLSPTHWQTPANFSCVPYGRRGTPRASDRGQSALPTCTASLRAVLLNLSACCFLFFALRYKILNIKPPRTEALDRILRCFGDVAIKQQAECLARAENRI
jgi:hypothetical protein